jgi:hypothetical protein
MTDIYPTIFRCDDNNDDGDGDAFTEEVGSHELVLVINHLEKRSRCPVIRRGEAELSSPFIEPLRLAKRDF